MSHLSNDIDNLKKRYREIFLKSSEELAEQLEKIKPKDACTSCEVNCRLKPELFENFPQNCAYKIWQQESLNFFDEVTLKEIYQKWMKILEYRSNFNCVGCATCCKLACSEFSYEELKQKAQNGDNFAQQFTSIFIPYEDETEPQRIYPEYIELLNEKLEGEKVYFYYCPKLTNKNRCSDYKNRPKICRDFPDNPLSLLPKTCGFSKWKDEIEPTALMLHSLLEIIDFYKSKLNSLTGE